MYLFSKTRRVAAATAAALMTGAIALAACGGPSSGKAVQSAGGPQFSDPRTIDNPYLPVTAHKRCEQRGEDKDGTKTRGVMTLLERTKRFEVNRQQVDAAVIQDNSYKDGKLIEIAYDYFAQADDGTVYYLGENVSNYENGKVIDHHGTWLLGKDTDVPGVAMPAHPRLGGQHRLEDVPGITSESNRVEEVGMRAQANGKLYTDVIRISEFIQPEGETEQKLYAPGVGKILEYPPDGRAEFAGCHG
jgi:hypothetical protein